MKQFVNVRVRLLPALCLFAVILVGLAAFGVHRHNALINNVRFRFQQHVGAHPLISGGQLVGNYDPAYFCDAVTYIGRETLIFSDRPYHTAASHGVLRGLHFCRTARHAETYTLIKVVVPTTLYAFGVDAMRLDFLGWDEVPLEVFIKADGLSYDKLYRKFFLPGRYIVNHAFQHSSVPVFWNSDEVKVIH
ncbi:MAG: hypothetical protein ISR45_05815 [Rhodospirillales bacterium]|nr:hypothetical protein [Rhodospirillales bacterium]